MDNLDAKVRSLVEEHGISEREARGLLRVEEGFSEFYSEMMSELGKRGIALRPGKRDVAQATQLIAETFELFTQHVYDNLDEHEMLKDSDDPLAFYVEPFNEGLDVLPHHVTKIKINHIDAVATFFDGVNRKKSVVESLNDAITHAVKPGEKQICVSEHGIRDVHTFLTYFQESVKESESREILY
jgi:hypothetical protein